MSGGARVLRRTQRRLDRHAVWRIVRRLARKAGINNPVEPHALRDASSPPPSTPACCCATSRKLRRMLVHTTTRYHPARVSLDRHASYIVTAFLAGARTVNSQGIQAQSAHWWRTSARVKADLERRNGDRSRRYASLGLRRRRARRTARDAQLWRDRAGA